MSRKLFLSYSAEFIKPTRDELHQLTGLIWRSRPETKMKVSYTFFENGKMVEHNTITNRINNLRLISYMSVYGTDAINPNIMKAIEELR
jgi:hypothetical protein